MTLGTGHVVTRHEVSRRCARSSRCHRQGAKDRQEALGATWRLGALAVTSDLTSMPCRGTRRFGPATGRIRTRGARVGTDHASPAHRRDSNIIPAAAAVLASAASDRRARSPEAGRLTRRPRARTELGGPPSSSVSVYRPSRPRRFGAIASKIASGSSSRPKAVGATRAAVSGGEERAQEVADGGRSGALLELDLERVRDREERAVEGVIDLLDALVERGDPAQSGAVPGGPAGVRVVVGGGSHGRAGEVYHHAPFRVRPPGAGGGRARRGRARGTPRRGARGYREPAARPS